MNLDSVRKHLAPYLPGQRRKTTVRHAFASARAVTSAFEEHAWRGALAILGQKDVVNLSCVYCDRPAQKWDHLAPLVISSKPSGHGHTIGNLVPACRDCNSTKGNKPWRAWVSTLKDGGVRLKRLNEYAALSPPPSERPLSEPKRARLTQIEEDVLRLLAEADSILEAHS